MGNLKVERELIFQQNAFHGGNVKGRFSFADKIVFYDDFLGIAIDNTNDWTVAGVNSGTATVTVPHCMTLTTGNAEDDDVDVAGPIGFYGQYNACIEVRFRNDDVSQLALNIGFSDATGEGANLTAFEYDGTTLLSTATDGAVILFDPDATTADLYFTSVKGDAEGAVIAVTGAAITTNSLWYTMRIELIDDGTTTNAAFYCNQSGLEIDPEVDLVGVELDAVTRDVALCPYIAIINHPGNTDTMDVDYVKVWQDRS